MDNRHPLLLSSLRRLLFSVPLRVKILGLAFGLITTFSLVTIGQIREELYANIEIVLREESRFVAREIAFQARDYLLINDHFGLNRQLTNITENRPDIRYAFVLDNENHVVAHTFGRQFPLDLLDVHAPPQPGALPNEVTRKITTNEGPVWDTRQPIPYREGSMVRVGVKGDNLRRQLSSFITTFMRNTSLIALLGGAFSLLLTWLITRPVKQLLAATQKIRRGMYDVNLPVSMHDEIGQLIEGFNAMAAGLAQGELARKEKEALQREFLQKVMAGQEAERQRLARELHDQTGQALVSCMVELKILEQARTAGEQQQGIARLREAITHELEVLHDLAMELRPSVLDDMGLVPALEMYIRNFEKRHPVSVRLDLLGALEQRANPCLETCVYRIIQEALANIAKHAQATEVTIFLEGKEKSLRGGIEDNGCGFSPEEVDLAKHMGIFGMRERVQLLGGSFHIDGGEGVGAMLTFEIPFKQEKCHEHSTNPDR